MRGASPPTLGGCGLTTLSDAAAGMVTEEEDDGMMRGGPDVAAGTGGNKGVGLGGGVVGGPVGNVVPVDIKWVTSQMYFLQRMMQSQQTDQGCSCSSPAQSMVSITVLLIPQE